MTDETAPTRGTSPLRIAYVVPLDVSRPSNGTATRCRQMIAHLAARHAVHLVYCAAGTKALEADVSARLPEGLASAVAVPQTPLGYFLFDREFLRTASELLSSRPFDLIVADFEKAGVYGALLARRHGVPFVYSSHDVEYERYLSLARRDWRRGALAPWIWLSERVAIAKAALVACITAEDARHFARWIDPQRIVVVPGGFDARSFNPEGARIADPPQILFVGNLTYLPNREAVEFLAQHVIGPVRARRPDARFVFAGVCPPDLKASVPEAEFTGFVDDLSALIRSARLVVSPIFRGGGMRIKTIEALACGKPVVATQLGAQGIDPTVTSRLRIVAPEQFAEAVLDELEHEAAPESDEFARLKEMYSSDAVLARFEATLRDRFQPKARA